VKPKVYIETTIVSYLVARPSRDILVAAHQQITRDWWELRREDFELVCSETVNEEAAAGDAVFARRRLNILSALPVLVVTDEARKLALDLVSRGPIPENAEGDAFHIAMATIYGCEYMLTWNCRHLANVEIRRRASVIVEEYGYELPIICTPEVLMGDRE
jgi:hypothetical protein